jgi:hypothetical protein
MCADVRIIVIVVDINIFVCNLFSFGGAVLQNLRPVTELDSSVPGEQKEVTGWFPEELEDCGKDGYLASRYPQKRNTKFFRSMTNVFRSSD